MAPGNQQALTNSVLSKYFRDVKGTEAESLGTAAAATVMGSLSVKMLRNTNGRARLQSQSGLSARTRR